MDFMVLDSISFHLEPYDKSNLPGFSWKQLQILIWSAITEEKNCILCQMSFDIKYNVFFSNNIWWCGNYRVANAIIKISILYYCWDLEFVSKLIYQNFLVNCTLIFQLCVNELKMSAFWKVFKVDLFLFIYMKFVFMFKSKDLWLE